MGFCNTDVKRMVLFSFFNSSRLFVMIIGSRKDQQLGENTEELETPKGKNMNCFGMYV